MNYFVATTGSDSNSGSFAAPFLTIAHGLGVLAAGDTLNIRAGTYDEVITAAMFGASGTLANPIAVQNYLSEVVILQPTAACKVIDLITAALSYVTVRGLVLDQSLATCTTEPVALVDSNQANITLEDLEIKNGAADGVSVAGSGHLIQRCRVHNNAGKGISLADDAKVINSIIYANGGAGLYVASADGAKLFNNTSTGNTGHGVEIAASASNVEVKNNILFNDTAGDISDAGTATVAASNLGTDPDFVNAGSGDYHLQSTSGAIDAGADLSAEGVDSDYDGNPRPINSLYDIGAYEYFSLSAPDPNQATGTIEIEVDVEGVGELVAGEATGAIDIELDVAGVGELLPAQATGEIDVELDVEGIGQLVITRVSENPKTYTLRVKEVRIGANGVLEWDLVREDMSIYDSVSQNPLIGANVQAGSPAPPDPSEDHSDASRPGATRLILLDIPQLLSDHTGPGFYAAATGISDGWTGALLFEKIGEDWVQTAELGSRAAIGQANTKLLSGSVTTFDGSGRTFVFDDTNTVDVTLIDGISMLESVSDASLYAGANAAAIGANGRWEIIAFGTATQLSAQKWRLSHLLRGLKGTEWAIGLHQLGDQFVLLDESIRRVKDTFDDIGVQRSFRAPSLGTSIDDASTQKFTDTGVSLKPLAPVYLRGAEDVSQNRLLRIYDRSRYDGLAGRDGVDDPPLDEASLSYEWDILNSAGDTVLRTLSSAGQSVVYITADQVEDFGSIPSSLRVCVYKISPILGRGYAGCGVISSFDSETIPSVTNPGNDKAPIVFRPFMNEPPASNFATLNTRNGRAVLDFDGSTDEEAVFSGVLSDGYSRGGLTVSTWWSFTSATSGNFRVQAAIERLQESGLDIDGDSFASFKSAGGSAPGTNGEVVKIDIAFLDGPEIDSLAAGEGFRLKIRRDADGTSGTDDITTDAELVMARVKES